MNNGMFRMLCSLLMMSSFCLMILFVWGWRKYKKVLFGIFFYLLTISIALQVINVGEAYQADRFMYLPSIGVFWALFYLLKRFFEFKGGWIVFVLIIGTFSLLTYQRNKVWNNSFRLWSDVIEKYPQMYLPYNNRGLARIENQQYDQAILDFDKAIERKGDYVEAYNNRGILYANKGAISFALMDFNQSIKLRPTVSAFANRANILRGKEKFQQALNDYGKALLLNPNSKEVYNNRGVLFYKQGRFTQAIADFDKALQIDPQYVRALSNKKALLYRERSPN
ncbi:hypothetical protein MNBD_BACTEROID05-725 [hydrothermal vent metagenome]|uniref:Uncharacterized protein n=1 Tax=hydrothermal vent metagenome TaxID=652676 RepID=A0A3B0TMY9_9ZZZZ